MWGGEKEEDQEREGRRERRGGREGREERRGEGEVSQIRNLELSLVQRESRHRNEDERG